MAEYIDRDKTIAEIDNCFSANPTSEFSKGVAVGLAMAKVAVNHTPAADVRPVVRCKDCRFREECVERFKAEEAKGEYDWLKEKKEKKHELGMDTHILCD